MLIPRAYGTAALPSSALRADEYKHYPLSAIWAQKRIANLIKIMYNK